MSRVYITFIALHLALAVWMFGSAVLTVQSAAAQTMPWQFAAVSACLTGGLGGWNLAFAAKWIAAWWREHG